jgi:aspartyl/asparaginyl beta-hydroxylase (cupin superfamily)
LTDLDQLNQEGAQALRRGDPTTARRLFERVVTARPSDVSAWFGLALACQGASDDRGMSDALDRVLSAEASHLPALLMKADHFAKVGDHRAAEAFYRAAVARAPAIEILPPELQSEVRRAQSRCADYASAYESHLRDALSAAGFEPAKSSRRFSLALDLLLGKKEVYLQTPTSFYYPELPHRQFYERSEFPWLANLEAKTDVIRQELLAVVADQRAFRPYVRSTDRRPPAEYGGLLDNLDWSAFYLIEDGAPIASAVARCPRTMEALWAAPLAESAGRTPSVLFSLLRPGARIPPHTGQINARLICHLPLIVPDGCGFRVGNEVRRWIEGETLIFDDTIEHEAWNNSGRLRVVLLFDIWRPELSLEERKLVAATLAAVGAYDAAASRPA